MLLLVIVIEQAITITKRAGSWVEQEVKKVFTACKHFSKRRMLRQLEIKMWFLAVLSGIETVQLLPPSWPQAFVLAPDEM